MVATNIAPCFLQLDQRQKLYVCWLVRRCWCCVVVASKDKLAQTGSNSGRVVVAVVQYKYQLHASALRWANTLRLNRM